MSSDAHAADVCGTTSCMMKYNRLSKSQYKECSEYFNIHLAVWFLFYNVQRTRGRGDYRHLMLAGE